MAYTSFEETDFRKMAKMSKPLSEYSTITYTINPHICGKQLRSNLVPLAT